ncbi:hypothetical protein KEM54_002661 [Ascosphaera aggregata]|nr:hypothetical protein KEM54_002661 [Ascosphaera aggregata]
MTSTLKTISAKDASDLDRNLMSEGGFSIDQLMELAGLSVAQAVYKVHPPSNGPKLLIGCGPGNNGGDGLVAARHLKHFGYEPVVYWPKHSNKDIYLVSGNSNSTLYRLEKQLKNLRVPFTDDFIAALPTTDLVIDSFFGFSFKGPVRDPYATNITALERSDKPVFSVDAPSSWEVDTGAPSEGPGANFMPKYLISLTAAKPLVAYFKGRHFVGGRFLTPAVAEKYGLDMPPYEGCDQIVEVEAKP